MQHPVRPGPADALHGMDALKRCAVPNAVCIGTVTGSMLPFWTKLDRMHAPRWPMEKSCGEASWPIHAASCCLRADGSPVVNEPLRTRSLMLETTVKSVHASGTGWGAYRAHRSLHPWCRGYCMCDRLHHRRRQHRDVGKHGFGDREEGRPDGDESGGPPTTLR